MSPSAASRSATTTRSSARPSGTSARSSSSRRAITCATASTSASCGRTSGYRSASASRWRWPPTTCGGSASASSAASSRPSRTSGSGGRECRRRSPTWARSSSPTWTPTPSSSRTTAWPRSSTRVGSSGTDCLPTPELDDPVTLGTEARDAHLDDVARLEILRWLAAVAHARRRPRGDHVAGAQRHEAAHVGHQVLDGKDHLRGVPVLPALPIDRRPQGERLRVAHLLGGDQPRAHRAEGVRALALRRGAAVLHLKSPLRYVVHQTVRRDVAERVGLVDVARVAPDHRAEFHLIVKLHRVARAHDGIVGSADRARRLDEEQRLLGQLQAHLERVIGVVEADGDHLADPRQRASKPRAAAHCWQPREVEPPQTPERRRRERGRREVCDDPRQIAQTAVRVDQAGPLGAGAAVSPPGISRRARSTSTWIHWWSPVASANLSIIA